MVAFHIDHLEEVFQGVEGGGGGDVVDEEKGIGAEVGGGPQTTIFFLTGGVGEGEEVGLAVDGAGDGVGVLWWYGVSSFAWGLEGWRGTYCGVVSVEEEEDVSDVVWVKARVATHSWVHWLRTSRNVMDDLPVRCGPCQSLAFGTRR